jgi:formate-dependent phosphoribosylglycinamide formyltransferase (GAR transformylase)
MKLAIALAVMLGVCASPAFAQQAATEAVNARALAQQVPSSLLVFPPPSATVRVIGTPTVQPSRGLGVECTPVEQSIAGVIIGPTDLCDR